MDEDFSTVCDDASYNCSFALHVHTAQMQHISNMILNTLIKSLSFNTVAIWADLINCVVRVKGQGPQLTAHMHWWRGGGWRSHAGLRSQKYEFQANWSPLFGNWATGMAQQFDSMMTTLNTDWNCLAEDKGDAKYLKPFDHLRRISKRKVEESKVLTALWCNHEGVGEVSSRHLCSS